MKLLVSAIFAFLAVSACAEDNWDNIDWSKVTPIEEMPGFWDERQIKPFMSNNVNRNRRVVGGEIVVPNSIPFQAGLLMAFAGGTGLCGGSIINARNVLSAAHCFGASTSTQVILGAHQLTSVEATQQRQTVTSANYRLHAGYNPQTLQNDVALLHLPNAVTFNQFIQPSVLPSALVGETFAGELATFSGLSNFPCKTI